MTAPAIPSALGPTSPGYGLAPQQAEADMLVVLREELDATKPANAVEVELPDGSFNSEAAHDLGLIENAEGGDAIAAEAEEQSLGAQFGLAGSDDEVRRALRALYGDDFPLALSESPTEEQWAAWAQTLFQRGASGVITREHFARKNRLGRNGVQWVSSIGMGPWREPPKPKDSARCVDNMIGPALDQRVEIIAEQRPGFRTKPQNQEQRNVKKAEAQQVALEYEYDQQSMPRVIRQMAYQAGTDGVTFGCVYFDPDRGALDELTGVPQGDFATHTYAIEQVRVSPDASLTKKPAYWVTRELCSLGEMVKDYGPEVATGETTMGGTIDNDRGPQSRWGSILPDRDELLRDQTTIERYAVYCDKSMFLPQGLMVIVVGRKVVVPPMPLPWGVVPLFAFRDGSTDPSFYPRPIMEDWWDPQMRVNALLSAWVEAIRLNKGQKLLAREQTIAGETLIGGAHTLITVKGAGPLQDTVMPLENFLIGPDVKELIDRERSCFEKMSGWNDTSRGTFQADQSGRSILAQREMLERIFSPCVNAAAEAMCDWAKIVLAGMRVEITAPRMLSIEGAGRPDLSREITADDFDGVANVTIDPETLMPMPRALRLFLLDSWLEKGLISAQEYRRRAPFAFTQSLDSPDTDHLARAKRCAEAVRQTANPMALPILWMDDEAIHQDVLQRELILPDDLPPEIRGAAYERWMMLAQQAQMKNPLAAEMAPSAGGEGGGGGGGGAGGGMSPGGQPFQGTNPAIAAGTSSQIGGSSDEDSAARQFDATQQR